MALCRAQTRSTDTVVASIGGVIPIYKVNNGTGADNRGYMGIELLQAPRNPGNYYIQFESLDGNYRVRQLLGLKPDPTAAGEFKGAFALCIVQGAEIVDENFKVADQLLYVAGPKQYRVRYTGASSQGLPTSASIDTKNSDGTPADSIPGVALTRVGFSNLAYSDLFTLNPLPGGALRASRTALTAGSLNAGTGVSGLLEATVSTQTVKRDTKPQVIVELTVFDSKGQVPSEVQRQAGDLMCPDADDDDLDNMPDYTMQHFPTSPANPAGQALLKRKQQDTVRVVVTKTAKPSDAAKLMIRGSTSGDSALHLYSTSDGSYLAMPYQVPWESVTQGAVRLIAETAGSKPIELTLYLENGPQVPDDAAKFHGCDDAYVFISGAGHDDSGTHYIQGFRHTFQSQRLCGFTDFNMTTGSTLGPVPTGDLAVISFLYDYGIAGLPDTDVAYQKVQQVLAATAAARAAGNAVIVGYSYGGTLAAAAAVEAKRQGQPFAFCGLIGPPIGPTLRDLFEGNLTYPTACATWQKKDIPGDPIYAGAPSFSAAAQSLASQLFQGAVGNLNPFTAPHFAYAQDINDSVMQQRRDDLIGGWIAGGYLTGACPPSQ